MKHHLSFRLSFHLIHPMSKLQISLASSNFLEVFGFSVVAHSELNDLATKVDTDADSLFGLSCESKFLDESKLLKDFLFVLGEEHSWAEDGVHPDWPSWNHSNVLSISVHESYDSKSNASHVRLEHLDTKINFSKELNQSHYVECKDECANLFTINSSNNVHWQLREHNCTCNNLENNVVTLESALSPALSCKFLSWWEFNLVGVFFKSKSAVWVTYETKGQHQESQAELLIQCSDWDNSQSKCCNV